MARQTLRDGGRRSDHGAGVASSHRAMRAYSTGDSAQPPACRLWWGHDSGCVSCEVAGADRRTWTAWGKA